MTGYRSSRFRHDCATRGCLIATMPNSDDLFDGLPRRIYPTDIDAMLEVNGHFLFLEWKRAGAALSGGQRSALLCQSAQPNTTVFILREAETGLEVLRFRGGRQLPGGWQAQSRADVASLIRAWAYAADSQAAVRA